MTAIAGVVLAAGGSRRFGGPLPKQLAQVATRDEPQTGGPDSGADQHETLVHRTCRLALAAGLDPVLAILGYQSPKIADSLQDLTLQIIENTDWESGQSTSVRSGVAALPSDTEGAMVLPCDQPFLDAKTLSLLIAAFERARPESDRRVVVPEYRGKSGAPVIFGRGLFSQLEKITGDEGGRQIFRNRPEITLQVELENGLPLADADTAAVLRRLTSELES